MVRVSAGLLFVYCVGAIIAPALASMGMRTFGPSALFAQNALLHAGLAIFAAWSLYADRGANAQSRSIIP